MSLSSFLKRKTYKLYSKIVLEKASPEYIARGWAIGMFFGCAIPFGFQLILSIPCSFLLKGSKVGATLGTLITNHFTIFIIYPIQCWIGNHIMGGSLSLENINKAMSDMLKTQDFESLLAMGGDLAIAFFIGGGLFALIMTPITYFVVKNLVTNYRKAKEKRRAKKRLKQQNKTASNV